jgi:phosphatidate cytidylyltransferase
MNKRVITSLVLSATLIPLLFLPTAFFSIVVGGFLIVASFEITRIFKIKDTFSWRYYIIHMITSVTVYVSFLLYLLGLIDGLWVIVITMGAVISYFISLVVDYTLKYEPMSKLFLSAFYIGLSFASLAYLQDLGTKEIVYLLLVTMLTDVFAYLFGIRFGKHKMAPHISPKKSFEGLFAGMIMATVIAVAYVILFDVIIFKEVSLNIVSVILISLLISLSGQFGDLIASKLKRDASVKDFGNLFPGHGGVLDRFDSTMFASLLVVFVTLIIRLFI